MGMLKKCVSSEATLCRVDNGINDTVMADRMQEFVEVFHAQLLRTAPCKEIICIDGKAERGTVQENGRNPDISIWKVLRKKRTDKKKDLAELMRHVSMSFMRLLRFLSQK